MNEFKQWLLPWVLTREEYLPHRVCYLNDNNLVLLNVVSDSMIALSYFIIPILILKLRKSNPAFKYNWVFSWFFRFIFLCGITHLLQVVVIWHPYYWVEVAIKMLTAFVSLTTAGILLGAFRIIDIKFTEILRTLSKDE